MANSSKAKEDDLSLDKMENKPGSSSCPKQRKRELPGEVMEKAVSLLTSMEGQRNDRATKDKDTLFVKYIVNELKKIKDNKSKALLKLKVQQLIFDAQFNTLSPNLVS
jgi:hypothetical protein